jgi:hypothetical protein
MDKYFKKKNEVSSGRTKRIRLTFGELSEIVDKKLWKTPFCQVGLDEDRVDGIINTWKRMKDFNLLERPLTIVFIKNSVDTEYWLIDGQHKLNAAISLYKNDNDDNNDLDCAFIECNSKDDIRDLFELINKDSAKSKLYVESDIFTKKIIEELKKTMKDKYKKSYSERIKKDSHIMSIDEFMDEIIKLKAFCDWPNDNVQSCEKFIDDLEKCNKKFWKDVQYLETMNRIDKEDLYYSDELNILNQNEKNCMFMKNNNFRKYFVEYLEGDEIESHHNYKNMRSSISSKLRGDVWRKQFKAKKIGTCPIFDCKTKIERDNFECGHIVSVKNDGTSVLENLLPICHDCNKKMSSMNINEYEKSLMYEKSKNKCSGCKKKTDVEKLTRDDNKLYCEKCTKKLSKESSDSDTEDEKPKKINK